MANKLRKTLIALLIVVFGALCIPTLATAFGAGEKTIESYTFNPVEAIIVGEKVDIKAKVTYTDKTTDYLPIQYTEFPIDKMSTIFQNFHAEGYIEGYPDKTVSQNIVVVPDNVEYMINLGANYGSADYYVAEENKVLGTELIPSGEGSQNEPYYAAIKRKFSNIRNDVAAKQYGVNVDADGDWGYEGSSFVTYVIANAPKLENRNLYENMMFPKRGTTDVSVKFNLPAGDYDVYIGFYSYWFARGIGISLNSDVIEPNYEYMVTPGSITYPIKNKTFTAGEQTIRLTGKEKYNEAMASFVCVTKADKTVSSKYDAPEVSSEIGLSDTSVTVNGLTAGAKLQMFDVDTNNLLYEEVVGTDQTSTVIALDKLPVENVFRFGFCQSNAFGMGDVVIAQKTDIVGFDIDYETKPVANKLNLTVNATAVSNIVAYKVLTADGGTLLDVTVENPTTDWEEVIEIVDNGVYKIELYSEMGGKNTKQIEITNIDNITPTFDLLFNLKTAKQSTKDKLVFDVQSESGSPIVEMAYVYNGTTNNVNVSSSKIEFNSNGGSYVFYMKNEIGKTVSSKLFVSKKVGDVIMSTMTQRTVRGYVEIAIKGSNGYSVSGATVYATCDGETEKMMVKGKNNSFKFNAYDTGTYFIETTSTDGSREITVLNVKVANSKDNEGGISENTTVILSLLGCLASIIIVGTCGFFLNKEIKNRKSKRR